MSLLAVVADITAAIPQAPSVSEDLPTRIAAIRGGTGPDWWARLNGASTITDEIGANDATLVNTADIDFDLGSLVSDGDGDSCCAFVGTPHGGGGFSISSPFQSAAFSVSFRLQVDTVVSTFVLLTIGGGDNVNGEAICKLVDDGAGGLKPQFESFGPSGFCVKTGDAANTIPVGESFRITYVRTASDMKVYVNEQEISMSVASGTLQTWGATPNDTWHFCYFLSSGGVTIAGYNGLMADVIVCDTALSESDIASLSGNAVNVVAATDLDMGTIDDTDTEVLQVSVLPHVHPEVGGTLTTVSPAAAFGTEGVTGSSLTFDPDNVTGNKSDSFGYRWTTSEGFGSALASVAVTDGGGDEIAPDLPFFGQYYGSVFRGNVGDTHMDRASYPGVFCFFRAERTGTVTGLDFYYRFNFVEGSYSKGNGGTYTIEVWPANPVTKLPITTGSPICRLTGWQPGGLAENPGNANGDGDEIVPDLEFSTTGDLVAKQPYALVVLNTAANPTQNYVSQNTPTQYSFDADTTLPPNYAEPGDDVAGSILPANVSATIKPIRGWHPAVIDPGTANQFDMYPMPSIYRGNFRYRRMGTAPMLMSLIYSDGRKATFNSGGGEHSYARDIQGANQVRERFKVTRAARTVSGVFIRVSKHSASGGNCIVTLESGPPSLTSGNGSPILAQVSVPAANFLECGNHFSIERWTEPNAAQGPPFFKVHWLWVPFSAPQTLSLGVIYSIRLSASGGFHGKIWTHPRINSPTNHGGDFDTFIANRTCSMNFWEDSMGSQVSTNSGATWAFNGTSRHCPILFKCV